MFSISLHLLLFLQTDDQPCPVCGHDYVQKLHTEAEYAAEAKRLQDEYNQRMAKYNSLKTKAARESAGMKNPPRRTTKSKIPQKHFCPCWQLSGKRCPECKGNAPKVQDPNGKLGDKISSCPVCQCSCSVGPFKNEDRPDLHEQYKLFCNAKGKSKTVSEHSDPGVGNLTDMAQVSIQVSIIQCILLSMYVLFVISAHCHLSLYDIACKQGLDAYG